MTIAERLHRLEQQMRPLEPDAAQRAEWQQQVAAHAESFAADIESLPAFYTTEHEGRKLSETPIGEHPRDMQEVLGLIRDNLEHVGLNAASAGHLGYIPGGGILPAAYGDYLAAVFNRYAGMYFGSPGAVRIENALIRWMCRLVGYPSTALGNLASGGSIANLTAITTARDSKGITTDKVRHAVIYLTEQVHHCVNKAIRIAGLGEAVLRYVPMDERFRMDADYLSQQLEQDRADGLIPFMIGASAGTTDTGSIDPLDRLADLSEQYNCWLHVDAAYGGFFLLTDDVPHPEGGTVDQAYRGIERSDSVAIDPHKGLFLPYGLGALLIKDVDALNASHYYKANYMQDVVAMPDEPSPADLSPELTKHFRGLRMWLPLQLLGVAPFKAALTEKLWLCRYFYQEIQQLGFEVGPEPELSVCIYRYVPEHGDTNAFNQALQRGVQRDGRVFISSTTIDGQVWLRLAVLSFRSHKRTLDLLLEVLREQVAVLQREVVGVE